MRIQFAALLVLAVSVELLADELLKSPEPAARETVVITLDVEVGETGVLRFKGVTYDTSDRLAAALTTHISSVRLSLETQAKTPLFRVRLLAREQAPIGRVMTLQQAVSRLSGIDSIDLVPSSSPVTATNQDARRWLNGDWRIVFAERSGLQDAVPDITFQFDGNKLLIKEKHQQTSTKIEVGGEMPMTIDVHSDGGNTVRGILARHGDILVLCWHANPDSHRPTEFATAPKSDLHLFVFRRQAAP